LLSIFGLLFGYARVSTDNQNQDLQHAALQQAGFEKIFSDQQSGAGAERPGLAKRESEASVWEQL